MLDDLARDIKAALYDRARSPFFFAFVAAWLGWNFPGVLVFFSSLSVPEKIAEWHKLYPGHWEMLSLLFFNPLVTCSVFILVYPWPAQWAFHYWHWRSTKVKEIQQSLEDRTPMTREEEKALRLATLEQQTAMQTQLQGLTSINRELVAQRTTALENATQLESELAKQQAQQAELSQKIVKAEEANASLLRELENRSNELATARKQPEPKTSNTTVEKTPPSAQDGSKAASEFLKAQGLDEIAVKVFFKLVAEDGQTVNLGAVASGIGESNIDTEIAVKDLTGQGLANNNSAMVWLTEAGKEVAAKLKVTKRRR